MAGELVNVDRIKIRITSRVEKFNDDLMRWIIGQRFLVRGGHSERPPLDSEEIIFSFVGKVKSIMTTTKFTMQTAELKGKKLRVNLAGLAGSGKTMSALKMAFGIAGGHWKSVALADTENNSAKTYSKLGPWNHVPVEAPYTPEKFVDLIDFVETRPGIEVLVIDSASHEYEGKGGVLEIVEELGKNNRGGSFAAWGKVSSRHRSFIERLLASKLHIITTTRTKTEYAMEGKNVVKVGMAPKQKEGFEYEFDLQFDLGQTNLASCTKDRTSLFKGKPEFVISEDTGRTLLEWAGGAEYVETYQGLANQKEILMGWFESIKLDKDLWKKTSDKLMGVEFSRAQVERLAGELATH